MLFGDQHSPFITILAVDPHVIIKGIEHNLHGLFRDSSINGHDYLRNIVHLPFFLQPSYRPAKTRKDSVGSDSAANHASGSKFSVCISKVNLSRDVIFQSILIYDYCQTPIPEGPQCIRLCRIIAGSSEGI